ncbi:hypothetical protein CONCODRAFT_70665 [Conidiobolus coronatus NRRL 28638]|uniref:Uncharacterized protein n=1 Tax=Conidiobolus coronatus (strain ATCC 28846 / CBS 209.66 / NRRL 28638) TaxID=796925 RepID=A0A137P691_CONC2|nr:hypothetical protein CONCODRAFT_70665 [Conidiobolus coronatus NRRL 28638]|eukprot:KXN70444.1 hypothetical protein CONCODRAFT_70665 [Conidiobolus coronatus NRRL 28638]
MTSLINLIVSLILADLYYGRVTGIESLHIQRSAVPFMKKPEGSLAASSLNRFPNVHPNLGSLSNVPSLNGVGSIKNGPTSPFSQSLRSASLDQPSTLAQNMPGLVPANQPQQIHPSPIQPNPSLNTPITDQKQDITRAFPLQQAQSSEPSVGPEDNVESAAHEQSMTDQSQAPQQNPGSNGSTDQDSGSDISSQPQGSMQMLDLPPLETMAEVPAKSLMTSASKSSDFEDGPLDENTLRSINLEVTKSEPIPNSIVGSDIFNTQDQSSENTIPLTQAVNGQPESPAPPNDPRLSQPNINLSQAVEPAAHAINQPGTPIAPVPVPASIPITPAPIPAPIAPLSQPQSPPLPQVNMLPQQPPVQQQIIAPEPQPQPNALINPNEKIQVINPNNLLNQPPTTVNPPNNPNSPPTSIMPNVQSNQPTPNPNQTPSQSPSPPPPPPPATPNPAPSNNPEQTPSPSPQAQETQTPSPTPSQDSQSTNAPSPSPTPDPSSSDSAKPSSSSSSTSYVFKSVKPINTLMDSNARPITSHSVVLLVSLLMVSVGGALFN